MNYGELRDYALQLINQYTIAGTPYAPSYNNQQDYILRVAPLINDALVYISSIAKNLPAQQILKREDGEEFGAYIRHRLPEDYSEIHGGGMLLVNPRPGERRAVNEYILQEPDYIMLPRSVRGDLIFEYYRKPQLLALRPADTDKIDAPLDAQMAIAYYVAAHLIMYDDMSTYITLYNEFENKVARLRNPITTEVGRVFDAYGVGGDGYG